MRPNAANFKTSDHVDLAYQFGYSSDSNNPTIFFCHGVGATSEQFHAQHIFAEDYTIVMPSLRGHGDSEKPEPTTRESMSILRQALDMLELADHLGVEQFHFVGHQIGGLIGLELLKIAPHRLLSLAVCGVSPCPENTIYQFWLKASIASLIGLQPLERVLGQATSKDIETRQEFNDMLKNADRKSVQYMLKSMIKPNYLSTLTHNHDVPVLLLRTEEDELVNETLDPCLEKIMALRTVDVIRVNSSGHLINMETPEYFNQILRTFLVKAGVKENKQHLEQPVLQQ